VDKQMIGITGHSRNGKQALLAAAFDERIGAVVASSGTTGECLPWRYTTDPFAVGSIEGITGGPHNTHWFSPRLRFFAGREQKLPVDQNMLLGMVAPRGLMMYAGFAEHEGNPFGYEQAYRSARRVYQFLGHPQNIWLDLRPGEHNTTAADIENFVNFFDTVFGRKSYPRIETWTHGYTFDHWLKTSGQKIDPPQHSRRAVGDFVPGSLETWEKRKADVKKDVMWALGDEPPGLTFAGPETIPQPPDNQWLIGRPENWLEMLFRRPVTALGMGWAALPFGDGLRADLYFPLGNDGRIKPGKLPVIVWLHSHSYATGYSRYAAAPFESLTRRGFAVLAFDQLGFGTRVLDARHFYDQYPPWSLMGRMVADTRAAIDAIAALDSIDAGRIYAIGYGLGTKVGLLTAALDGRIKALAAVCGFDALRLDSPAKGTEGVRHYSHLHGLIPRLGFFVGEESRLPFDYDAVVALAAPRPE
jgi:dienelactone hydrolase